MWKCCTDCDDKDCICRCDETWACLCKYNTTYGVWDNQQATTDWVQLTPEDIAKLNEMFGEMDLTSDGNDEWNIEILERNLEWMKEKFGWDEDVASAVDL